MIKKSTFKPLWWLRNRHGQTIYASLTLREKAPVDKNERLELPDGDFIDLAWATGNLPDEAPLVVILHGLGGSVQSRYVSGFMHAFNKVGWRAVLMHFRGASEEPNRLPRAYHSGDTGDLHYLLQVLNQREPHSKKAVVGVSLGGNVLLKWLGEIGRAGQSLVQAGVAISVPLQLDSGATSVNSGFSRLYQTYLLHRLKKMLKRNLKNTAPVSNDLLGRLDKLNCFWTFDDQITAPLHGFPHVHAYYKQASSRQYIKNITTPTLIIQALDDPLFTEDIIPKPHELADCVDLELSEQGGHVGFISGEGLKPVFWLDQRLPEFLRDYLT